MQLVPWSALRPAEWSAVALLKFLISFAQRTLRFPFSLDSPSYGACPTQDSPGPTSVHAPPLVLLLPCELLSAGWI